MPDISIGMILDEMKKISDGMIEMKQTVSSETLMSGVSETDLSKVSLLRRTDSAFQKIPFYKNSIRPKFKSIVLKVPVLGICRRLLSEIFNIGRRK